MSDTNKNDFSNPYSAAAMDRYAADAPVADRTSFIRKTYAHLFGAILTFIILEVILMQLPIRDSLIQLMTGTQYSWLIVLGFFMAVSYGCERMARNAVSLTSQYTALAIIVLAWAILFLPLIALAIVKRPDAIDSIILPAAFSTVGLFAALSLVVFFTGKDFSFLRGALYMGGFIAIGLIVTSIFFGFALGPIFTIAMIGFASLWVLYDTSNVMHHYRTDQHVSASLALFASIALLFWYILRLFMNRD